ncbi:MAG: N-acetylmuramidase [Holosporaceae bacterium]|jgi:lysozyme family protein|nr:N-acetylmuramidase [Holosporaceae bacterium]
MDENFDEAFEETMEFEGGYVNDPDDPGGETKYGISKRSYPLLDIKNLTRGRAKKILYLDFWIKGRCDEIAQHSSCVAKKMFDVYVNLGLPNGTRVLQRALRANDVYVEDDGIFGPKTMEAMKKESFRLLPTIRSEMAGHYRSLPEKLKEKYLAGWLDRAYC